MDGARYKFFACPAFAGDQNRARGRSDRPNHFQNRFNGTAVPHDTVLSGKHSKQLAAQSPVRFSSRRANSSSARSH